MRQQLDFWRSLAEGLRRRSRLVLFSLDLSAIAVAAWVFPYPSGKVLASEIHHLSFLLLNLTAWLAVLATFAFYDVRRWRNHPKPNFVLRQALKLLIGGFLLTNLVWMILPGPDYFNLLGKALVSLFIAGLAFAARLGLDYFLHLKVCRKEVVLVLEEGLPAGRVRNLLTDFCSDYLISAILTPEDLMALPSPSAKESGGGVCRHQPEVLYSLNAESEDRCQAEIFRLRRAGLHLTPLSEVLEQATGRLQARGEAELFSVVLRTVESQLCISDIAKRVMDFTFALLGLIIFAPVLLVLALLIKLDSPGPAFYRQRRVGRYGRIFELTKLRSMVVDAERETGAVWAQQQDARTTRTGKWLRQLHLDEIPQLINVLKGEMSLVGPRPERPELIPQLACQFPAYAFRLGALPGVTGWAQINRPSDISKDDVARKLDYDLYYLKNRNAILDLRIILRTLDIIFFGVAKEKTSPEEFRLHEGPERLPLPIFAQEEIAFRIKGPQHSEAELVR